MRPLCVRSSVRYITDASWCLLEKRDVAASWQRLEPLQDDGSSRGALTWPILYGHASVERLDGRVGLVTGGGRGIGEAVARELAAYGMRIAVTGRTEMQVRTVPRRSVASA